MDERQTRTFLAAAAFGLLLAAGGAVAVWFAVRGEDTASLEGWFAYAPLSTDTTAEEVDGYALVDPVSDVLLWAGVALVALGAGLAGLFGGLALARRSAPSA
ncbi:hypothetical protein [Cellulomonas palmilytica]|uniref:hypothetical protein n=1 Tax=Cellulomonas palmilytica TaxID=2608402 RepID=UPI001F29564A|nr:hypothetical protein [Cellulomonas palmilytica]UJP40390.1 hypothetical protein F1D97_02330 [Cellulomonas palmilytica]